MIPQWNRSRYKIYLSRGYVRGHGQYLSPVWGDYSCEKFGWKQCVWPLNYLLDPKVSLINSDLLTLSARDMEKFFLQFRATVMRDFVEFCDIFCLFCSEKPCKLFLCSWINPGVCTYMSFVLIMTLSMEYRKYVSLGYWYFSVRIFMILGNNLYLGLHVIFMK